MCSDLDFKSCNPNVVQREDIICFYVEKFIKFQHTFDKNTIPCEMNSWDFEDLNSFKIDENKVDRLYHMYCETGMFHIEFEVIVRMQYNDKPLYAEMVGNCFTGVGHIFLSRDVDVFMKCVLRSSKFNDSRYNYKAIYELLKEDGIHLEEGAPTLQHLCYNTISNNIVTRQEYKNQLPKMLVRNTTNFIKTKEAINHYDNIMRNLNIPS